MKEFMPLMNLSSDRNFKKGKDITWKRPNQFLQPGSINLFDSNIQCILNKVNLLFLSFLSILAPFKSRNYSQIKIINKAFMEFKCVQMDFGKKLLWMIIFLAVQVQYSQEKIEINYRCFCWKKLMLNYLGLLHVLDKFQQIIKQCVQENNQNFQFECCTLRDLIEVLINILLEMKKNFKQQYILATSSLKKDQQHYYAIFDIQKVTESDGIPDIIIKIRNTWTKKQWTKDWSYYSVKWTPELRQRQLSKKDEMFWKNDGIFWMSIKDFLTEFSEVCELLSIMKIKNLVHIKKRLNLKSITQKGQGQISPKMQSIKKFLLGNQNQFNYNLQIQAKLTHKNNVYILSQYEQQYYIHQQLINILIFYQFILYSQCLIGQRSSQTILQIKAQNQDLQQYYLIQVLRYLNRFFLKLILIGKYGCQNGRNLILKDKEINSLHQILI
ncbi:unnamed protein product [Paramecium primaurelia]|uniref:Calpain catalytic domain-containing protein n=1 Tax=Paramecium primaurelia TaxID=5886 RepID=A0A8S1PUT5_PARPR|nr:unnamed protein product [Paramecium primaurelia]